MRNQEPVLALFTGVVWTAMAATAAAAAQHPQTYVKKDTWSATMQSTREAVGAAADKAKAAGDLWGLLMTDFPVQCDWFLQDNGGNCEAWLLARPAHQDIEQKLLGRVLEELGSAGEPFRAGLKQLVEAKTPGTDQGWLDLYAKACQVRRQARLKPLLARWQKIAFAKHYPMGGSHYAYTEGQSDAQAERHFRPGTALCVLELSGGEPKVQTLIDDPKGVIRDVDVSYDGKRILFSWKKSDREDDYHLYDLDAASGSVRQLTSGLGYADYEGCYLPNGDILFNSTRCVQIVDCWFTEVSNLYTCDQDGRFLRRLSFDQVHTNYPTVMDDGRVIYTRWDYNDRGQLYPQPLFQMNSDGTAQTEFYGNNSWFPTTIIHARGIPGTTKVLAIFTGHHSRQAGKLGIVDPSKGRQENSGTQLIAPVRPTPAEKIDAYGQQGELFQYPYPLNESQFLVSYAPLGWKRPLFGIYFMDIDGRRELLAADDKIACARMVPLAARTAPHLRPSLVDYRRPSGLYYMQDIYAGPGLAAVPRGTVKNLRVVALQFRVAGIGSNGNGGPAGGAIVSMPVSINNGSWDVKTVLGNATVYEDGSAYFEVPARTPVYFQALDAKGYVVQSMRSWSTLQPGEKAACVGCHEDKNDAAPVHYQGTLAMKAGPQDLMPFYGPPRGFSFSREIQPILDKHCIKCHDNRSKSTGPNAYLTINAAKAKVLVDKESTWHYTGGKRIPGGWQSPDVNPSVWPEGKGGFGKQDYCGARLHCRSDLPLLALRRTFEVAEDRPVVAPILNIAHLGRMEVWINGVRAAGADGESKGYQLLAVSPDAAKRIKPGTNHIGVLYTAPRGATYVDVGLLDGGAPLDQLQQQAPKTHPFSLLGAENPDGCGRLWSDSYLALTQRGRPNPIVNWLNAQSVPPMLPPYFAGAATSKLMTMLDEHHNDVHLTREELEKIACWIDLLVPYCGDYVEAHNWSPGDVERYNRYMTKRRNMEELDRKNLEALVGEPIPTSPLPQPQLATPATR